MNKEDPTLLRDAQSEFGWIKEPIDVQDVLSLSFKISIEVAVVCVGGEWHGMKKDEAGAWFNFMYCNAETHKEAVAEIVNNIRDELKTSHKKVVDVDMSSV